MKILTDENFENEYNEEIVPFCEVNEKSDFYTADDGKQMHYLAYINPRAKANVLIIHGFTECAKKFDEMAYYLFNEGYSVFAPDLRGHGLSYKDPAPKYGVDCMSFDEYSKDIACFINKIVASPLPLYCYTHSLGGNAALLTLIDNPDTGISKLVLSSPMICGNMGMPVGVAKAVATLVNTLGLGKTPAPGKCVFEPEKGNPDAASIQRGKHALDFKVANEEYQTCGPTFRWVINSLKAKDKILSEENIEKINTDMLVIKPETDRQLLEEYQDEFIDKCKAAGRHVAIIQTRHTCHEIYQSCSEEMEKYVRDILNYFAG